MEPKLSQMLSQNALTDQCNRFILVHFVFVGATCGGKVRAQFEKDMGDELEKGDKVGHFQREKI